VDSESSDLELKQRQFLKNIDKIIPEMISKLEQGYTMLTVKRLGRKQLLDGRIIELRLEAEVIGIGSPGCGT
jgi:hypothetical protein